MSDPRTVEIERSIIKRFRKEIWRPFVKALNEYDMIQEGDNIAVCISGGKDSMLLAKCMQEILRHGKMEFGLKFLVMDPGYHPANRQLIEENAKLLGIPVTIFESDIFETVVDAEIYGKEFYLAHGDGLGDPDKKFKLLRSMFHSKTLQTLFSAIHPRWSVELGLTWAKHSRQKRADGKEPDYMGENQEHLVLYTKEYLKSHPNINFFIYGHRHIELDLMLSTTSRVLILGDWINYFSYAVFDGENLFLEDYIEGETQA